MILNKLLLIFSILFYPFINIFILFVLGIGLTYLVLPKFLKNYWLWLSPWTTIIMAILYFVIVSLIGFSVIQSIIPFLSILLSINFYVFLVIKPKLNIYLRTDLIMLVLVFLTLILNLSPLIRHDKFLTTISMGNNDIIAYTTVGDYLKEHSIGESFQTKVELTVDNLLHDGYRWGTPIINSFFLTLLNLQGYQYTYTSQCVLFSLFLPLLYIFFQILYGKKSLIGLITVIFFSGFNANLLYMLYHDFFGQVLFWGIEILLFIFIYSYFYSKTILSDKLNIYDIILGILISVLFFSYHEPAIFMFLPIGIYLGIILITKITTFKFYLSAILRMALIGIVIGSFSIINAIVFDFKQAFMGNPNQPIGWQLFRNRIPFANPFEAMGFWSIHNFEPMKTLLAVLLSIFVVLILTYGYYKSKNKLLTASYLIIFLLFYYWTAISQHNFFSYNRALTYTLPFMIVIFSVGITKLYEKQKYLWLIIIMFLVGLELYSAININKRLIREHLSVEKSYTTIQDLKKISIKSPIYMEGFIESEIPLWKQIWVGYFLYSKNISPFPTIYGFDLFENKVPDNSLVLISKPTPWLDSLKIIFKNVIWENKYYTLGHLCNSDKCLVDFKVKLNRIYIGKNNFEDSLLINGWNVSEGENRWANEKESTLRLINYDSSTSKITFEALTLKNPQEIMVYLDGRLLGKEKIGTEWKKYSLPIGYILTPGVHKIKLIYYQGYRPMDVIPGNLDNRLLYVNFKNIALE
jgi:hypothetical protein